MSLAPGSSRWSFRSILQRAREVIREEGVAALFFRILGETIYRRAIVIEHRLDGPIPEFAPRVPVEIGVLDETQIEEYVSFRPEADRPELLRRLEKGDVCHTARHDGRLVYVSWSATRRAYIEYLDREIDLAPGDVYSYAAYAAPEFRGANIVAVVGAFRMHYFAGLGYRRIVAVVVPENTRALRSFAKLGYRPCGTMGCIRLGPWRYDYSRVDH